MTELFPITVIAAVLIFLLKEVLEGVRRATADDRKRRGIKTLLAAELERNHFALSRLSDVLTEIDAAYTAKNPMEIRRDAVGRPWVYIQRTDGDSSTGMPSVHSEVADKYLLDLASLDKASFEATLRATDTLKEVKHVGESVLQYVSAYADEAEFVPLGGFAEYGLARIEEGLDAMRKLYLLCTGKPLTEWRVR